MQTRFHRVHLGLIIALVAGHTRAEPAVVSSPDGTIEVTVSVDEGGSVWTVPSSLNRRPVTVAGVTEPLGNVGVTFQDPSSCRSYRNVIVCAPPDWS